MGWGIRQSMIVVRALAARGQKSRKAVGQPQSAKDIDRRLSCMRVSLGIKRGDIRRQAIVPPNLHDVLNQLWFLIEILPGRFATVEGGVRERHQREVCQSAMRLQVIEEPAKP